jgi:hypothetical protein
VLTDSDHLTCEPLQELKALIRAGHMPRLVSLWGVLPGGDCELIATAFMTDIAAAAPLGFHWRHVTGDCAHRPDWVESGGWSFGCSHGDRRPVLVMRTDTYAAMRGLESKLLF